MERAATGLCLIRQLLGAATAVPCCFVLSGEVLYTAVDAKPKSTLALRRLDNVRAVARAVMLVDHYAEEWAALWWVRIDGRARVIDSGPEFDHALQLLAGKHEQYLRGAPRGPDMLEGTQAGTAAALDLPGAWLTDAQ